MKTGVLTLRQFMPLRQLLLLFIGLFVALSSVNGQVTFSAGGLPSAIPDPGNLNNIIAVSGLPGTVAAADEVQINVAISHAWASDIVIGITPPGGTEIIIVNRIGGGANIDMVSGNVLSFRSNAAAVVTVPGLNGVIPAGIYLPSGANAVGSFSSLIGATRNGTWTIRVRDDDSIIQGSLQSASISFFNVAVPCPPFSGAPANVTIVNSTCSSNVVSGGSITAPTGTPCPAGSTLQYNVDNSGWTTTLPNYNQTGPAQSIVTRCSCDSDANNVSAESTAETTMPGVCAPSVVLTCPVPTTASACLTQSQVDAAYNAWLTSATASGGCNGSLTNDSQGAPSICSATAVTRTVIWTYTSTCAPTTTTCSSTFTVPAYPTFTLPANGAATVTCPALAVQPTPPSVVDGCGKTLTPTGPVVANVPNPLTCEGTRTYVWTYTDCAGHVLTWSFVYTIERNAFTVPANGAATVNSPASATQPTPPTVTSNCGETLTPTGPVVTNSPNPIVCTGTRTYAWTYTDCEGNTATWSFVYTIIDNAPPMATCSNSTVTFNGQESIVLNANTFVTATDNCGIQSITLNPTAITCQQVGQQVPVTATVTDNNGNTATCTSTITVAGLPCGWSQNPDGVGCAGGNSNAFNAATGVYTATSTGCFYGPPYTADETSFAQRTLCSNGSITALVTGISGSALGWAGIVMRESNAAGAKKAQLMTNLSTLSRREFRTSTNGASQQQQFPSQDRYWLRITRVGNQFTMFVSANGISWFPAGSQNIVMSNCIQMGLAATNYTANSTVTATFSNVSFTGSSGTLALPGGGVTELAAHSSQLEADFNVYPNPTGGELNVDLTQYIGRSVRLETYSLEGKLLQFTELDEVQNTLERLDLKGFQNGMYLVKVKSAGLPDATKRVVLQRG